MSPTDVYDTNVIVSAAIKPGSIPASLVALATEHKVRLFLSRAILEEYSEVLNRPKFELVESSVAQFLRDLMNAAVMVTPTRPPTVLTTSIDWHHQLCLPVERYAIPRLDGDADALLSRYTLAHDTLTRVLSYPGVPAQSG